MDRYLSSTKGLRKNEKDLNLDSLQKNKEDISKDLKRFYETRESLKQNRSKSAHSLIEIDEIRAKIT